MSGNYFDGIMREAERIKRLKLTGLHHISVLHDDWCDLLAGRGPCNCNPEVQRPVTHADWQRRN